MRYALLSGLILLNVATAADFNPLDYTMTIPIQFEVNAGYVEAFSNLPPVNRVNIDMSFDSGSNWTRRVANGLSITPGSNVYYYSLRVTPEVWSDRCRFAVRTLYSSATNIIARGVAGQNEGDMSDGDFTIAGVRWLYPQNGTVLKTPSYPQFSWHEVGFDSVDIGYSTNAGATWLPLASVLSPSPTNYCDVILDVPTGKVSFVVSSRPDLFHVVECNVQAW